MAGNHNRIISKTLSANQVIAAGANGYSNAADLYGSRVEGSFGLEVIFTSNDANSTLLIQQQVSLDGVNYYIPANTANIANAQAVGGAYYSVAPPVAKYFRVKMTEGNSANSVSVNVNLIMQ